MPCSALPYSMPDYGLTCGCRCATLKAPKNSRGIASAFPASQVLGKVLFTHTAVKTPARISCGGMFSHIAGKHDVWSSRGPSSLERTGETSFCLLFLFPPKSLEVPMSDSKFTPSSTTLAGSLALLREPRVLSADESFMNALQREKK